MGSLSSEVAFLSRALKMPRIRQVAPMGCPGGPGTIGVLVAGILPDPACWVLEALLPWETSGSVKHHGQPQGLSPRRL